MIKLIKITIQYIISAYTTDRHILIIGISLLQEGWRWHCYSHSARLCLRVYLVTFDYSTLKAHILKIRNDRNKRISDSASRYLEDYIRLRARSIKKTYMCKEVRRSTVLFNPVPLMSITFCMFPECRLTCSKTLN